MFLSDLFFIEGVVVVKIVGFITTYAITKSMPITTNVVCSTPLRQGVLDTTLYDKVCQ